MLKFTFLCVIHLQRKTCVLICAKLNILIGDQQLSVLKS